MTIFRLKFGEVGHTSYMNILVFFKYNNSNN